MFRSLAIMRKLAQKNPDAYLPAVADVLRNLGVLEAIENRLPEAHALIQESLAIYRRFNAQNPSSFIEDIAKCEQFLAITAQESARKKSN